MDVVGHGGPAGRFQKTVASLSIAIGGSPPRRALAISRPAAQVPPSSMHASGRLSVARLVSSR